VTIASKVVLATTANGVLPGELPGVIEEDARQGVAYAETDQSAEEACGANG
jgi:hypothetical protein